MNQAESLSDWILSFWTQTDWVDTNYNIDQIISFLVTILSPEKKEFELDKHRNLLFAEGAASCNLGGEKVNHFPECRKKRHFWDNHISNFLPQTWMLRNSCKSQKYTNTQGQRCSLESRCLDRVIPLCGKPHDLCDNHLWKKGKYVVFRGSVKGF